MSEGREIRRRIMASRAQEQKSMHALGGTTHSGSGNGNRKGDGRVNSAHWTDPEHQIVEFKRTDNRQIIVKLDDLETIIRHALQTGRTPVFGIQIQDRSYVIQSEGDYREKLELIRELRAKIEELGGDPR